MNRFTWNYINLVVNVFHMLLILSPSVSTALLDTRQTFLWTLLYQPSHLPQTDAWVLFVLSYLVCWDFRIHVECSASRCAYPLCCVFLAELGLIRFNLELTFTFLSLWSIGNSHTHSLTHCISHTLATDRIILLASVWHCGQGITLRPIARTPNDES